MREEYRKWHSPNLSRDVEMLVFGERGYPVILFPTSRGSFHENRDQGLIESVRWFVENGLVKIYCPDSFDALTWYNRGVHPAQRAKNYHWYDQMLYHELVPWAAWETGVPRVATAGCSFGAYHATNFALKHPDRAKYAFNMSGVFDIRRYAGGHYDDHVYFNNPADYLPNAWDDSYRDLFITLGTGSWDICLDANVKMAKLLGHKGIHHWLDIRHEALHDWPVWRQMFPHYLSLIR